jgi:hypothetical protein
MRRPITEFHFLIRGTLALTVCADHGVPPPSPLLELYMHNTMSHHSLVAIF